MADARVNAIIPSNVSQKEVVNLEDNVLFVVDMKDFKDPHVFQIVTLRPKNTIHLILNAFVNLDVLEMALMSLVDLLAVQTKYGMENVCVDLDLVDLEQFVLLAHQTQQVLQQNNVFVTQASSLIKEKKHVIKISALLIQSQFKQVQGTTNVNA